MSEVALKDVNGSLKDMVREFERQLIEAALAASAGNQRRAAASLGLVVGFSVQEIDDLNIAVTQACESAIAAATQQWGSGNGQLKLVFKSRPRRLEVEVRSVPPRAVEQQTVRRAQREAELDYETIGLNMIRLFVDELRYQVDNQTGSMRMRMVKYLIE